MNVCIPHIIVLSGHTGVGKTTLAQQLATRLLALHVSTSSMIFSILPDVPPDRASLQRAGNALDHETEFRWIANQVSKLEREFPNRSIVVDSVRKPMQILALREQATSKIMHAHLEASYDHLVHRHSLRSRSIDIGQKYEAIVKDISESYQVELAAMSDMRLDAEKTSPSELAEEIIFSLGITKTDT